VEEDSAAWRALDFDTWVVALVEEGMLALVMTEWDASALVIGPKSFQCEALELHRAIWVGVEGKATEGTHWCICEALDRDVHYFWFPSS
jgi:hypothetical protein